MTRPTRPVVRLAGIVAPVLLACWAGTASAAPAGANDLRLVGKFAFRTNVVPEKASCTQLTEATASRLASPPYKCERTPLESGKTALYCSRPPEGSGSFLVFDTKAACDSTRRDNLNAE